MRHVNHRTIKTAILLTVAAIVTGCTAPPRGGDPVQQSFQAADAVQRDRIWTVSADVLRDHGFRIDRFDRRAGIITTRPQTSQQFFEFWRKDVNTPYDWMEASFRTIRRHVEVETRLDESGDEAPVTVTVYRETFATPERQFNNSIAAFRMFGDDLPSEESGERVSRADDYWIPDGRDPAMESYFLDQIAKRLRS